MFKSFVVPAFDGSKLAVFALNLDRDGSLWVGTLGNGLFRIRGNVVDHYGRTEGLSSEYVNDLFADREGILWVMTTNGIDSFRDPRVTTFSTSEGLGEEEAVGVLATKDGTVWVANNGSLDKIKSGSVTSIRSGHGLPGDQVSYMLEDRDGNLWIGVYDGLYVFKNGRFRRISEPDHQPLGLILGMAEDIDGNIWAVCSGVSRKLIRIRDFQVREQFPNVASPNGADRSGSAWRDLDWSSHGECNTRALSRWCPEEISDRFCYQSRHQSPDRAGRRFRPGILRRRTRRTATGQSAANDDEKRASLRRRLFLRRGQTAIAGGCTRLWRRRASRFRASTVVGQPGSRGADKAL